MNDFCFFFSFCTVLARIVIPHFPFLSFLFSLLRALLASFSGSFHHSFFFSQKEGHMYVSWTSTQPTQLDLSSFLIPFLPSTHPSIHPFIPLRTRHGGVSRGIHLHIHLCAGCIWRLCIFPFPFSFFLTPDMSSSSLSTTPPLVFFSQREKTTTMMRRSMHGDSDS